MSSGYLVGVRVGASCSASPGFTLARGTVTGAPLPDRACCERSTASAAGLPCSPVSIEALNVLFLLSVHAAVVAQGRSSAFETGSEDIDDGLGEFFAGPPADPIGGTSRMDAGSP